MQSFSINMERKLSISLLVLLNLNVCISQLLFCLNGPQKLTATDCPNGVILLKPLKTDTCAVLGKTKGTPELKVELNSTLCGSGSSETMETHLSRSSPQVKTDQSFQAITIMEMGGNNDYDQFPSPGSPETKCIEDCLTEWIDPAHGLEDDPPYPFAPAPAPFPDEKNVSEKLFTYMSYQLDKPDAVPPSGGDYKILDVFRTALDVLEKHCRSPYVTPSFIHRVYAAHRWLVIETKTKLNDLGIREHRLIIEGLKRCLIAPPKFVINGTSCGDRSEILAINTRPSKLEAKSFRPKLFDPIIEVAWNALEFVHGYCFKEYQQDIMFQHILVKAVEALFNDRIITRWRNPTVLKHDTYWDNLLDTKYVDLTMRNIDSCIQGGWRLSPYQARLGRPFEKQPGKYAGSGDSFNSLPLTDGKPKGYPGPIDKYWQEYDSKGGIKSAIVGHGICAQNPKEMDEYMKAAMAQCKLEEEDDEEYDSSEWDKTE